MSSSIAITLRLVTGRKLLSLVLATLFGSALVHTGHAQQPGKPSGAPSDTFVEVGGHKMHLILKGPADGAPTIILEAGGGGSAKGWTSVQDLLATRRRTCAYDRAGSGLSEPGPAPRTMEQEAFELHELLKRANVPGPYVLVGQSMGGLLVRLYAQRYGQDVIGLVLVDPTDEQTTVFNLRLNKWIHLRDLATGRPVPKPKLIGRPATQYKPEDDYLGDEIQAMYLARRSNPLMLGNRPLLVLGAGQRPPPPGVNQQDAAKLKKERDQELKQLTELSSNSRFILASSSTHNIEIDDPRLVADAIEEVVVAAVKKTRVESNSSPGSSVEKHEP